MSLGIKFVMGFNESKVYMLSSPSLSLLATNQPLSEFRTTVCGPNQLELSAAELDELPGRVHNSKAYQHVLFLETHEGGDGTQT